MRSLLFIILFGTLVVVHAQQPDSAQANPNVWKQGGLSSLTFSQVSLENWAAGGENSSSVNAFFSVFADRQEGRKRWFSTADLGYGLLKQGDRAVVKSDDRINLASRYSHRISKEGGKWFINAFVDFRTQFAPGFAADDPDSVISRFLAPAYITVGSGIEYAPNEFVTFGYTPVSGKITIVNDDAIVGDEGAYGVLPGNNSRFELGSFFRFNYKQEAFKNINVDTRLELFTNYEKETFGNIDVNWQNSIVMKVNKYISTNLFTQLLYDDDINIETKNDLGEVVSSGPRTQFKTVFGVGVVYSFGDSRPKE